MLGTAAIASITLLLLTAFGIPGAVAAVLFTTILGVPAAGGVYPSQAMPGLFRFLGGVMPLRYLTDGARSIMWFDGRGGAGLTTGAWVLAAYTVVCVALSGVLATAFDRRHRVAAPTMASSAEHRDAALRIKRAQRGPAERSRGLPER